MAAYIQAVCDCVSPSLVIKDLAAIVTNYAVWRLTFETEWGSQERVVFNDRMEIISWNEATDYAAIIENAFEALSGRRPPALSIDDFLGVYDSPIPRHIKLVELGLCQCRSGRCHFVCNATPAFHIQNIRGIMANFLDHATCTVDYGTGWTYDYKSRGWTVMISETSSRLPDLGNNCCKPYNVRPCPIRMEPGLTYVTIAALRLA
jgi:hypothetical protein